MQFVRSCLSLLLLFTLQPIIGFSVEPLAPKPSLTADQRIEQVLSRLTFGPRPGDFESVKKVGIKAYVERQLDPGAIDDSALNKRLEKFPTLGLSNPTLAEVYNPPK